MKLPEVEYEAPTTVAEAVGLLAEHGDEASVLAGGQSLIPLMNFRLAKPGLLVVRVFDEQLTKLLFGGLIISMLESFVGTLARLSVACQR